MRSPRRDDGSRLEAHYRDYRELVATARRHVARGRADTAAAYAQMAGQCAWFNHAGMFASAEVEDLLRELAAELPAPSAPATRRGEARDVLHVVTQTYQTGGPTQAIACWLEQDCDHRHRVCITRQGSTPPPSKLLDRLEPQALVRLDTRPGGILRRAQALRALAMDADVVLLHAHPYDVTPVIAFAGVAGLPPVIYVNHGDHVFWIGTTISTAVLNLRDSGHELAIARRGVAPERSLVMPRPLMPRRRDLGREEAKRRLGIDPDVVLLVTAADAPKYRPVNADSFLGLVTPVVERHPEAVLLAAGPSPDDAWRAAADRTGGRLRALGRLPDVTVLHEAADVYLDSFPFASLTSLLEAAGLGTPAMTYRGHPPDCGVLGADTRGIDEHLLRPSTPEELDALLSRAITDGAWRERLGERLGRAVQETHTGEGWRAAAAEAYAFALRLEPVDTAAPTSRGAGTLDVLVEQVMTQTGLARGRAGAVADHLGLLPLRDRVAAWAALVREDAKPPARNVSPEWLLPYLGDCYRLGRRLIGAAP